MLSLSLLMGKRGVLALGNATTSAFNYQRENWRRCTYQPEDNDS